MASTVTALTKDVWTKVLTNVTYAGAVHILDIDDEPTEYGVAFVDTGDPAPLVGFTGGVKFNPSFSPSNAVASDYYVMPKDNDGSVVVLT